MASKRTVKSSSSGEVFQKAVLSLSSDIPKDAKSKQKRKERLAKPKTSGQKATSTRRQKTHSSQMKTRSQMANKENDKGSEKSIKSSIAEKLSLLRNPKVISSEPITKRKVLGTIQSSIAHSGSKLPPVGTKAKLEKDLRRVLAREEEDKSTCDASSDPKSKRNKKEPAVVSEAKAPSSGGSSGQVDGSVSSSRSESETDCSPVTASVPLKEISLRLVDGLQTNVIFPDSNYLENVKAELKKLMKQSDPEAYTQLMLCISDKPEATPAISAAILAQQGTDKTADGFDILQPRFFDDSNYNPLHTFCDPTSSNPSDLLATMPGQTSTNMAPTNSQDCDGSCLLPPIIQHPMSNPLSAHMDINPSHFHLPTVILHPDIEPSAMGDSMLSQHSVLESDHMSFTSAPAVDFLDYLDAGSLDCASNDTHYGAVATGGMECCRSVVEGVNPTHQWMPSPDRPRMFPRKLY